MCGLVGIYSSNMMGKHKDVLTALLYLDTWRGRDSTGVAAIRVNADTEVMKQTIPGYDFVDGPKLEHFLKLNDFCWIGHNRFGTIGKNTKGNAHPFTVEDEDGTVLLVGAHNGTLKNRHNLDDYQKFGTDSEALFNQIAHKGLEDTLGQVEGAWALTYYDHNSEELKIIRNKERPLFYAFEEGSKTLIWASEMWMIRVAMSRAGLKLEKDQVFSFNEDTLYSFPAPEKINDVIGMQRKGGVVGKEPVGFFQRRDNWVGGRHGHTAQPQAAAQTRPPYASPTPSPSPRPPVIMPPAANRKPATSNTPSTTPTPASGRKLTTKKGSSSEPQSKDKSDDADTSVIDISSAKVFKGFDGVRISRLELTAQLADGCAWCEDALISITDKFGWLGPSKPICQKCLDGTHDEDDQPSSSVSVH